MDSILIHCRPRDSAYAHTLRAWLEQQAAGLSARPGIRRATIIDPATLAADDPHQHGWLLECQLVDPASPPSDALRELLTDMRLIGFDPIIFTARPSQRDSVM
jgi:hypothetical protein